MTGLQSTVTVTSLCNFRAGKDNGLEALLEKFLQVISWKPKLSRLML